MSCGGDPCLAGCPLTVSGGSRMTLMRSLIPCVDQARNIHACLGTRSYQVVLVRTKWSGGARGKGTESVLAEEQVLPVPLVEGMGGVQRTARQQGLAEEGDVTVREVSARYTEDQLLGLNENGSRIPKDESFYWEIRAVAPGAPQVRRRFFPAAVPALDMGKVQWVVRLAKASDDRGRFFAEPRS